MLGFIWMMYAILGIFLLGDKLGYCIDLDDNHEHFDINFEDCKEHGTWANRDYNFDNLVNALITLFVLGSFEGWPEIMKYCYAA